MNYAELDTASDILEAFRLCNNPGEEIELFESLATRPNPPVTAFVEILQMIKLEPALVLTIKAFGAITDPEVKERLKQSDDLLVMLSEQAKSGASDLIRWAAAVSIDKIGFNFLVFSRYLSETPIKIAERIVESKKKILISYDDKSKGEQNIEDRNDYREFINFWVYGATYELRTITACYHGSDSLSTICGNAWSVIYEVVDSQKIYCIRETNKLLYKAEAKDYSDELTKQAYENEIFEEHTQDLSAFLIKSSEVDNLNLLIRNQAHCLQSNNRKIRLKAASILLEIDKNLLNSFEPSEAMFLLVARAITCCNFNLQIDFAYPQMVREELEAVVDNLKSAGDLVSRDEVSKYFTEYTNKLSKDLSFLVPGLTRREMLEINRQKKLEESKYKQQQIAVAEKKRLLSIKRDEILRIKSRIDSVLSQVIPIDNILYMNLKEIAAEVTPEVSIEHDNSLDEYRQLLMTKVKNAHKDYCDRSWKNVSTLTSLESEIGKELSNSHYLEEEPTAIIVSTILPGCGCAFWGLVFMAIPNVVCTIIGIIIIIAPIIVAIVRINKSEQIRISKERKIENRNKYIKEEENLKVIENLIRSI